ncbi:MAG TPA: glycine oxidase ThiO [Chloroflexota bacterium]|nr:glycine oxidase ThiO [Chloroflexota bacterium]
MQSFPGRPTTPVAPEVVIVGGGSIGCSIAYQLALDGVRSLILERDYLAAGASGVAAGMLAPQVEAPFDDPFFDLTLAGRKSHGPLAAALYEDVGLDVECRATGILRVALDEADRVELQRRQRWQTARGLRADWLESEQLGECEPLLNGVAGRLLAGGLWLPDEGQVRSPRLVQALAAASVKRGAMVVEGSWAVGFERRGDRISGVRTPQGIVSAETVVLAAGVWSTDLAQTIGLDLPVGPVKGQILTLRAIQQTPRTVIWSGECYLVPRVDGQVILGATEEDGNYDRRPTLAGIGSLSEAALEFLPAVGQFTIEGIWAGLRPAAPDRYPIVGRAPGFENLILATAHYRNGILLGPLTGRWISQLIRSGVVAPEFAPFGPERFISSGH